MSIILLSMEVERSGSLVDGRAWDAIEIEVPGCANKTIENIGARGGNRTPTALSGLRILSPMRLPVSP
ncbi:MAG: hypothetical protein U1F77_14450, partial [Kiritimatiellia bacterium]